MPTLIYKRNCSDMGSCYLLPYEQLRVSVVSQQIHIYCISGLEKAVCLFDMLSVENCLSMPDPDWFHLPKEIT